MSSRVYLKIDQKVLVTEADVFLGQIASVWCADKVLRSRCLALRLYRLPEGKPQRVIGSVLDIVRRIQELDANVQVENLGESDFILVYQIKEQKTTLQWIKCALVCLILFFGSAFAMITFNHDVEVSKVFDRLYEIVLGSRPQGISPMEWGYVIGLPVGILGFYNHFSAHKKYSDPTPLQVQMRQYEKNINNTIIENEERRNSPGGGKKR